MMRGVDNTGAGLVLIAGCRGVDELMDWLVRASFEITLRKTKNAVICVSQSLNDEDIKMLTVNSPKLDAF